MSFNFLKNYKQSLLAIILLSVLVLTPTTFAHAGFFDILTGSLVDQINSILVGFFYVILKIVAAVFELVAKSLAAVINFQVGTNAPIVALGWGIVRDFANMFFIVIMIVMAFATIFDLGSFGFQGYDINSLIAKFLIAALLINFSLAICGIFINGFNVLNGVFLNAMGDFSNELLKNLKPWDIIGLGANSFESTVKADVSNILPQVVFSSILLILIVFALLVALIVAIARIPVLWMLMIFSPLAYLTGVLPLTRGLNKKWWENFIKWNTFLPILLVTLYFGMTFLKAGPDVMAALGATASVGLPLGANLAISVQQLFFYIMIAIILIGGTMMAIQGGTFAGAGGLGVAKWASGAVKTMTGYSGAAAAITGALGARRDQLQKEGLPGRVGQFLYGGQNKTDVQKARLGAALGVSGARGQAEQLVFTQQKEKIDREAASMRNITGAQELRQLSSAGSVEQRIAARQRLADMNELNGEELKETYAMLGGDRSPLARDFALKIDFGNLTAAERQKWQATTGDLEVKKKLATVQAEKGDIRDSREITELTNLFRTAQDKDKFLEKIMKNIAEPTRLRQLSTTGSNEQQLAAMRRLNELGELNGQELRKIYSDLGGDQSPNAREFALKIDFGKLTGPERSDWQTRTNDLDLKKKIALVQADKGDFRGPQSRNEVFQLSSLFRSDAEKGEFLDKVKKRNFATSLQIKTELGLIRDKAGKVVNDYVDALSQEIGNLKIDDLIDFPIDTLSLQKIASIPPADKARYMTARQNMIKSLSEKKIGAITEKVSAADLAKWDELFLEARSSRKKNKPPKNPPGGGQQPPPAPAGPGTPPPQGTPPIPAPATPTNP